VSQQSIVLNVLQTQLFASEHVLSFSFSRFPLLCATCSHALFLCLALWFSPSLKCSTEIKCNWRVLSYHPARWGDLALEKEIFRNMLAFAVELSCLFVCTAVMWVLCRSWLAGLSVLRGMVKIRFLKWAMMSFALQTTFIWLVWLFAKQQTDVKPFGKTLNNIRSFPEENCFALSWLRRCNGVLSYVSFNLLLCFICFSSLKSIFNICSLLFKCLGVIFWGGEEMYTFI